jgi:hypothetical protein
MIVKCIANNGQFLREFEYSEIQDQYQLGRFGATGLSNFGVEVGFKYYVMGIIIFKDYQAFLLDHCGHILTCPCQLFEILDNKIPNSWKFTQMDPENQFYPFIQAIFGYEELVSDPLAYEKLIVEKDPLAYHGYFKQKSQLENQRNEELS